MNPRGAARVAGTLLVACIARLSNAIAQEDPVSLDELVIRITSVASDQDGITPAEQELASQLHEYGAEAIPRLLPLLEHRRKGVKDLVGYVLRDAQGLAEEHLDALMKARRNGNRWIPPAIARIGTPRAIEFLVHDLELQPETQTQVTYALRLAGEPAAFALAQRFRVKRRESFDKCACEVFRELGERAAPAVGPLLDAAMDRLLHIGLRRRAVTALGSCGAGARKAAPHLLALAASDPEGFQSWVENALVEMHAPESLPVLQQRLDACAEIRTLRDLQPLGPDGVAAGPLVLKLLDHVDHDLRVAAAHTLGIIGYSPAADALARLANDGSDWQLAAAAIESLVQLHATSSIEVLDEVAKRYWSPFVRASALRASRRLHAIARGVALPFGFTPEVDVLSPPHEVSSEPMPALEGESDGLTGPEWGLLTYGIETSSSAGRGITHRVQLPGCGLSVDGGVLLGATRGEWGGEVVFVPTGAPAQMVLGTNTIGLHRLGNRIVAVTGLAHAMSNEGALYWIDRRSSGSFSAKWCMRLPGAPSRSGVRADGALFVRGSGGDVVVMPNGMIEQAR